MEKKRYRNGTGKYSHLADRLYALLPSNGFPHDEDANPALCRFAHAGWYYRDIFNNGLCNYRDEAKEFFGFDCPWKGGRTPEDADEEDESCDHCGHTHEVEGAELDFDSPDMEKYERALDEIYRAAAIEQKIPLRKTN